MPFSSFLTRLIVLTTAGYRSGASPIEIGTHGNYWTNPVNYDMTLNSEKVGIQDCVKIIEQFLILKGYITEDEIGKKIKNEKK